MNILVEKMSKFKKLAKSRSYKGKLGKSHVANPMPHIKLPQVPYKAKQNQQKYVFAYCLLAIAYVWPRVAELR